MISAWHRLSLINLVYLLQTDRLTCSYIENMVATCSVVVEKVLINNVYDIRVEVNV